MRRWTILAVLMINMACVGQVVVIEGPPKEETADPQATPFATPVCQPADGVTMRLQKISDTFVEVIASGLQPGEYPYVYYDTLVNGVCCDGGGYDGNPVNEDGEFFFELDRLAPPEGQPSATWDIRLVHARGVECAMITLP